MAAADPAALNSNTLQVLLALSLVVAIALALSVIAGSIVRRLLLAVEGQHPTIRGHSLVRPTVRLVRFVVFFILTIVLAFPALDFAGVDLPVGLHDEDIARWIAQAGCARPSSCCSPSPPIGSRAPSSTARSASCWPRARAPTRRNAGSARTTISRTFRRFVSVLIWTISVLVVLRELDVDITPILTGAGILGLAIGFGAQTLVKDIISGVFLIVEDQVRVGDVALVNGVGGSVEQINLRTIVMRDIDGTVHVIPNGEIRMLANRSKDFAYYVFDLGMDYDDDTDDAVQAVKDAAADLQADPVFGPSILEPLEVLGVDNFAASSVSLKFRIKTVPLKQWEVGRELRRRVKKVLDARGIKMPFPQMQVTIKGSGTGNREPEAGIVKSVKSAGSPPSS